MKKILITCMSVFALVNVAFAQNYQHKIDSLQNEKSKAEKAKLIADKNLRENLTQENYEAVKVVGKQVEDLDKEIKQAVKEQEAEAKAKAYAKAEEEKNKALELYKKRFPAFEFFNVDDKLKQYMYEQLQKDPKWDINKITSGIQENTEQNEWTTGNRITYETFYRGYIIIEDYKGKSWLSTSGTSRSKSSADKWIRNVADPIKEALELNKNPTLLYEAIQKKAKQDKLKKDFENYYFGYTGETIKDVPTCNTIKLYERYLPNDGRYYYKVTNYSSEWTGYYRAYQDGYEPLDRIKAILLVMKPGSYFLYECDGKDYGLKENIVARKRRLQLHKADEKVVVDIETDSSLLEYYDLEPIPAILIRTFKVEDYM